MASDEYARGWPWEFEWTRSLSINRCSRLTDRGVRRLLESPTLKTLVVSAAQQISDTTILELKRRLERLVVVGPSGISIPIISMPEEMIVD